MNPRFKSTFSLLHVLVIATIIIIHSKSMIYSSSVFDQRELHQGFRMHKVGRFELQLRWQVGSGIGNRILLYKIRFSFPHPCHLNIWRRIKKFKSDWKLVLGGQGTQLSKLMGTKLPAHDYSIRPFRRAALIENSTEDKCSGKWLVQVATNDMLGNGCNIMAQIQSGLFGTAANVWIWRIKNSKWTSKSFPSHSQATVRHIEILVICEICNFITHRKCWITSNQYPAPPHPRCPRSPPLLSQSDQSFNQHVFVPHHILDSWTNPLKVKTSHLIESHMSQSTQLNNFSAIRELQM